MNKQYKLLRDISYPGTFIPKGTISIHIDQGNRCISFNHNNAKYTTYETICEEYTDFFEEVQPIDTHSYNQAIDDAVQAITDLIKNDTSESAAITRRMIRSEISQLKKTKP